MTTDVEIELTKGQAGYERVSSCSKCRKFIRKDEDSVRVETDYHSEWLHLKCFIEICKPVLEKAGYSTNPSKRDIY